MYIGKWSECLRKVLKTIYNKFESEGVSVSEQKHNNMQSNDAEGDDSEEEAADEDLEWEKLGQREPTISPLSSDDEFVQGNPQDKNGDPRYKIDDPQEEVPQESFTPLAKRKCKRTIKKCIRYGQH